MTPEYVTTGAAATYTVASGLAIWLEVISVGVGLFAGFSGIILTWVMIRKYLIETRIIKDSNGTQKKERRQSKRKVKK